MLRLSLVLALIGMLLLPGCLTHLATMRIARDGSATITDTVLIHGDRGVRPRYQEPTVQSRIETIVRSRLEYAREVQRTPFAMGDKIGAIITFRIERFDTLTVPFYAVRLSADAPTPKLRLQRRTGTFVGSIIDRPDDKPATTGGQGGGGATKEPERMDPTILGMFADQLQSAFTRFTLEIEGHRADGARLVDANGVLLFEFDGAKTAKDMRDAADGRTDDPSSNMKLGLYLDPASSITFTPRP